MLSLESTDQIWFVTVCLNLCVVLHCLLDGVQVPGHSVKVFCSFSTRTLLHFQLYLLTLFTGHFCVPKLLIILNTTLSRLQACFPCRGVMAFTMTIPWPIHPTRLNWGQYVKLVSLQIMLKLLSLHFMACLLLCMFLLMCYRENYWKDVVTLFLQFPFH